VFPAPSRLLCYVLFYINIRITRNCLTLSVGLPNRSIILKSGQNVNLFRGCSKINLCHHHHKKHHEPFSPLTPNNCTMFHNRNHAHTSTHAFR